MNPLYQPENPPAILARCKIKPWEKSSNQIVMAKDRSSTRSFIAGECDPTKNDFSHYELLSELPSADEFDFTMSMAALVKITIDRDVTKSMVHQRLNSLMKNGFIYIARKHNDRFNIFRKTELGRFFEQRMEEESN